MPDTDAAEAITVDSTEAEPDPPEDAPEVDPATTDTGDTDEAQDDGEAETFPRSYVEELRRENARYRERARSADTYAKRLHTELVRATGRLADPTDLEFTEEHLDDPDTGIPMMSPMSCIGSRYATSRTKSHSPAAAMSSRIWSVRTRI